MWFLPKNYVWVSERIEKAHDKFTNNLSIETEFDIKDQTVIFTAKVKVKDTEQTFIWHSFWEVWKEKAFEKLETVAVWRALAFAWFEVKSWIASREEMDVFESKWRDLMDVINEIREEDDLNHLEILKEEWKSYCKTDKQKEWLKNEYTKLYTKLSK